MKFPGLTRATLAGAVALSFAATGCDGSSATPVPILGSCGVAPCGGDVVGDWTATSACMDEETFMEDLLPVLMGNCQGVTIENIAMTPRGTLTMTADMSFTGVLDVDTTYDSVFPPTCYPDATCADVEMVRRANVGTKGLTSVNCAETVDKPGWCTCTDGLTLPVMNSSGKWATSGTTLTFGLYMVDGPYCVQGSSLHLVGYGLTNKTKIVSDLVLSKQ